jgi:small-conductance mechanosensitive channel/CRP-like cAMP-binding protein
MHQAATFPFVSSFEILTSQLREQHVLPIALGAILALAITRLQPDSNGRHKIIVFAVTLFLLSVLGIVAFEILGINSADSLKVPAAIFGTVTAIGTIGIILFRGVLPKLKIKTPRIVQDVLVALATVAACVAVLGRANVNLSGLIATSAVFTAVLGFSLQDVVGNIAGGLALQLDQSVSEGDWVKIGDITGRVSEVRWRHTAVETRNWETVLIPNSVLMKSQVMVLGKRTGMPQQARRWVYFNVDFRHQPGDVIRVIQTAVRDAEIARVAKSPEANCVLMDITETYGKYAVRYFLNDIAVDDPTDSEVRACIYFALQRAGMTLAIPTSSVYMHEDTEVRQGVKEQKQQIRREQLLKSLELFSTLPADEIAALAQSMRYAPFAPNEVMTKQNADAHWLYVMEEGIAAVRVSDGTIEKEVAQLKAPTVFGEMSLLTGEKRTATVIARSEVECFRIDKSAMESLIQLRPALAQQMAQLLAKRKVALDVAREHLDADAAKLRESKEANVFLASIKSFFSLS